jgi:hypothetical protein
MRSTEAKYKVYLHQDTLMNNRDFIREILAVFKSNNKIGLLGLAGYKTIPPNGVWWEAGCMALYGRVMQFGSGKGRAPVNYDLCAPWYFDSEGITGGYVLVKGVDGLLMATQYDLPWREELFDGWHFYDVSQSLEFVRNGYEVGVPYQEDFWAVHACLAPDDTIKNQKLHTYDHYRKVFLAEYQNELLAMNQ